MNMKYFSSLLLLAPVRSFCPAVALVGRHAALQHPQSASASLLLQASSHRRGGSALCMMSTETKGPSGHQAPGGKAPQRSPEDEALSLRIQEHQKGAAKLSKAEEVRTLIEYSTGYAVISTNSQTLEGYPNGAVVGFAPDEQGRPVFAFSSMSSHTGDLAKDGRASLTVMSSTFKGASDGRVTLTGDIERVTDQAEKDALKAIYKQKHPNAFWVNFGDFAWHRMSNIKAIRFVGGFAMAGEVTPDEYYGTAPDPITQFAGAIASHMNQDHSSSTAAIVEHFISGKGTVDEAEIAGVDRLGMYVVVTMKGEKGKLRVPFLSPAADRKAVKDRIVELTRAASGSE